MTTYRANGVGLQVIAVATPHGIIRAINHGGGGVEVMVDELVKAIGLLNLADTEWTGYTYRLPYYVDQWASGWDVPGGIYLYPWLIQLVREHGGPTTYWNDPKRRISEHNGQLLWRPRGWAGERAEREGRRR